MSEAHVVKIEANTCIGCTKCISVCPTDAIVGASKQLHVVLTEYCIGCDLCLPPCPVNCIDKVLQPLNPSQRQSRAQMAKSRISARQARLERINQQKAEKDKACTQLDMQEMIEKAIAKSKHRAWVYTDE